jgi:hypothetical protein
MISIFKNEDFRGLQFPIHKVDQSKDLLKELPDLKYIQEFVTADRPDRDKLIRYIVLMYSKDTPLSKKFTDLAIRKKEAATLSGFDMVKDSIPVPLKPLDDPDEEDDRPEPVSLLQSIYNLSDETIGQMVIGFLRHQDDLTFTMLASNEQTFYEYQQALMSEITDFRNDMDKMKALDVKTKLMDESDKIAARIQKYRKDLYVEDKIIDLARKRNSSPESVAVN